MKRLFALVMVLCLLCISLAGCGAKAKEPSEEEYLAWAEKAWNVIKEVYEEYAHEVINTFGHLYYKNSDGNTIFPAAAFFLKDDLKKVSKEESDILSHVGYYQSEDIYEAIQLTHTFLHSAGNEILGMLDERSSFTDIPEKYIYIDSQIVKALQIISEWHAEIINKIENGAQTIDVTKVGPIDQYGVDKEIYDANYPDNTSSLSNDEYMAARKNARIAAGGIEGPMEILYALLG